MSGRFSSYCQDRPLSQGGLLTTLGCFSEDDEPAGRVILCKSVNAKGVVTTSLLGVRYDGTFIDPFVGEWQPCTAAAPAASARINAAQSPLFDSSPEVLVDLVSSSLWDRVTLTGDYGPYEVCDPDFASVPLKATDFDGTTGYINLDVPTSTLPSALTLCAWVQFPLETNAAIICKGLNNQILLFKAGSYIDLRVVAGGSDVLASAPTSGWHHIAATVSGTTGKIFIDGAQAATGTVNAIPAANSSKWVIGQFDAPQGGYYLGNPAADARIYSSALDAADIADIHAGKLISTLPLAWYKLDDTGAVAYDSSGNEYNGTHVGGVFNRVLKPSASKGWVDFDGVSGSQITHPAITLNADHTLAWWSRSSDQFDPGGMMIGGGDQSLGADRKSYVWYRPSDNTWRIRYDGEAGGITSYVNTSGEDGNWHHYAWVRTGTTVKFYIDGVEVASQGDAVRILTIRNIGGTYADNYHLQGSMSDYYVYDSALNSYEIKKMYSCGVAPDGALAHWPLDEVSGSVYPDVTGNGYDGVASGGYSHGGDEVFSLTNWQAKAGYSDYHLTTESSNGSLAVPAADLVGKTSSTISFSTRTSDANGILLSANNSATWLGAYSLAGASTINSTMTFSTISVDGVVIDTPTRGELYTAIADGQWHDIVFTGVDLTKPDLLANGLFVSGYGVSSGWNYSGQTTGLTVDGVEYSAPVKIPRDESEKTNDVLGGLIANVPVLDHICVTDELPDGEYFVTDGSAYDLDGNPIPIDLSFTVLGSTATINADQSPIADTTPNVLVDLANGATLTGPVSITDGSSMFGPFDVIVISTDTFIEVDEALANDEYTVVGEPARNSSDEPIPVTGSFTVAVATGSATINPDQSPIADSSPNVLVDLADGATLTGQVTLNDGSSSHGPYDVIVISTDTYIEVDEVLADGTYTVEGTPAEDSLSGPLAVTGSFTIVGATAEINAAQSPITDESPPLPVLVDLDSATLWDRVTLTGDYGSYEVCDPDFMDEPLRVADFDGVDGYLYSNGIESISGSVTIALWIAPDTAPASVYRLVSNRNSGGLGVDFQIKSNGALNLYSVSMGSVDSSAGAISFDGSLQHVAATIGPSGVKFYVDGSDAGGGSGTAATVAESTEVLRIGRFSTAAHSYFNGRMSSVLISLDEMTPAEVASLHAGEYVSQYSAAEVFLKLDDSGAVAYDSSGNGCNFTHSGGVAAVTASGANVESLTNWRAKAGYGVATDFNGTDGKIAIDAAKAQFSKAADHSGSIRIKADTTAGTQFILSATNSSADRFRIAIESGQLKVSLWNGSGPAARSESVSAGQWYTVAWSYNSTSHVMSATLNGVAMSGILSVNTDGTSGAFIGCLTNNSLFFDGQVSYLQVDGGSLYKLDEESGTSYADSSVNGFTGTATGGVSPVYLPRDESDTANNAATGLPLTAVPVLDHICVTDTLPDGEYFVVSGTATGPTGDPVNITGSFTVAEISGTANVQDGTVVYAGSSWVPVELHDGATLEGPLYITDGVTVYGPYAVVDTDSSPSKWINVAGDGYITDTSGDPIEAIE